MKALWGVVCCWIAVLCTLMVLPTTKWAVPEQVWFQTEAPEQGEHFPTVTIAVRPLPSTFREAALVKEVRHYIEKGDNLPAVRTGMKETKDSPLWLSSVIRQGFAVRPPSASAKSKPNVAEATQNDRYFKLLQEFASYGDQVDQTNSYWPLIEAGAYFDMGKEDLALAKLKDAASRKRFDDYGIARVKALASDPANSLSGREKATLYASETFPHFAWFLRLMKWARAENKEAQWYMVATGTTIMETSDASIGVLAGGWIVRQALGSASASTKGVPSESAQSFDRATRQFHPDQPDFTQRAAEKVNRLQKAQVFSAPSDLDTALAPWPAIMAGAAITYAVMGVVLFGLGSAFGREASATSEAVARQLVWLILPLCVTAWQPSPSEVGALVWIACGLSLVCLPFAAYEKTRSGATIFGWFIAVAMLTASFATPLAAVPAVLWITFPWLRRQWAAVQWPWIVIWPALVTFGAIVTTRVHPSLWLLALLAMIGLSGVSRGWTKKPFPPLTLNLAIGLVGYLVCVNWQVQNDKAIEAMTIGEGLRAQKLRDKIDATE